MNRPISTSPSSFLAALAAVVISCTLAAQPTNEPPRPASPTDIKVNEDAASSVNPARATQPFGKDVVAPPPQLPPGASSAPLPTDAALEQRYKQEFQQKVLVEAQRVDGSVDSLAKGTLVALAALFALGIWVLFSLRAQSKRLAKLEHDDR